MVRQLKELVRAKANVMLLEAAKDGSTFMVPKLLDRGLPLPDVDFDAVALPDVFSDMEGLLAEKSAKPGAPTCCVRAAAGGRVGVVFV